MMLLTSLVLCLCFIVSSFGEYLYESKFINVPVDHFSSINNRTFRLKYLINDSFWEANNGPIFFYAGNEGEIEVFAQNTGFVWEAAEKFKALVVFAEHRYYGESSPIGVLDDSERYKFLSIKQVLADFVDVLYELRNLQNTKSTKRSNQRSNPVIVFGGSYGGLLALWLRLKYPTAIDGALVSSAPLLSLTEKTSCDAFNKALTNVFNETNAQCAKNIRNSWIALDKISKDDNGTKWINENWKFCKPISKTKSDIIRVKTSLIEIYYILGMMNYPYSTDVLMSLPANPVKEMCRFLSDSLMSDEMLLNALHKSIFSTLNHTGKFNCLDWSVHQYQRVDMTVWGTQACSELVIPKCSNGITDMFNSASWDFNLFSLFCNFKYDAQPIENYVVKEFGKFDLHNSSNIIFSNGLLDPWISGGVTGNISSSVISISIPDAAHHLDLRATHPNDPSSVTNARKFYVKIFKEWITDYRRNAFLVDKQYDEYLNSIV